MMPGYENVKNHLCAEKKRKTSMYGNNELYYVSYTENPSAVVKTFREISTIGNVSVFSDIIETIAGLCFFATSIKDWLN